MRISTLVRLAKIWVKFNAARLCRTYQVDSFVFRNMFAILEHAEITFRLSSNEFFFRSVKFHSWIEAAMTPHLFCKRQVGCGQGDIQATH